MHGSYAGNGQWFDSIVFIDAYSIIPQRKFKIIAAEQVKYRSDEVMIALRGA